MVDLRRNTSAANGFLTPDDSPYQGSASFTPTMIGVAKLSGQPSPIRQSPRRISSNNARALPTPISNDPASPSRAQSNGSPGKLAYPPNFDNPPNMIHTSSRYPPQHYTPYSPYRPGEYGRSGGLANGQGQSKFVRRLFEESEDEEEGKRNRGSSPLQPAFQANMVLRKGAPVDLISWMRKNFHPVPTYASTPAPVMSLLIIRKFLEERFPRVPEQDELIKAVSAAFPHSQWDYPAASSSEPPYIRGLGWHGQDRVSDTTTTDENGKLDKRLHLTAGKAEDRSTSPENSTLVSPISNGDRKLIPQTPARSVLEEFADIVSTQAEKTPASQARELPADIIPPAPAYVLANICNSTDRTPAIHGAAAGLSRKRNASQSPVLPRRRAATPDGLQGLIAAAEAVEGSPIDSFFGHKRRRTIGSTTGFHDVFRGGAKHGGAKNGLRQISPTFAASLSKVSEDVHDFHSHSASDADERLVNRAHTNSTASQHSLSAVSISLVPPPLAPGPSPALTNTSQIGPNGSPARLAPRQRKANELPTEGDNPGIDCKPPYPYHELIRHAIENAPDQRLQLSQIYQSIAERFPFFKTLDDKKTAGWQNSIRHNLSLKKMFVRVNKIDGVSDEGGKGGWWIVQEGVLDEGRPGRKAKIKRRSGGRAAASAAGGGEGSVGGSVLDESGEWDEEGEEGEGEGEGEEGDGDGEGQVAPTPAPGSASGGAAGARFWVDNNASKPKPTWQSRAEGVGLGLGVDVDGSNKRR